MQVILRQDYGKLGQMLDIVSVKDGYARNFLMPKGIAVRATEGNKKIVEEAKRSSLKREEKRISESRQIVKKIEDVPCTIPVKVKQNDEIFGSVTAQDIADFLAKEGFTIEKSSVLISEPIRQLGVYSVPVKVYKDIQAMLKVWVVKEEVSA